MVDVILPTWVDCWPLAALIDPHDVGYRDKIAFDFNRGADETRIIDIGHYRVFELNRAAFANFHARGSAIGNTI